MRLALLVVMGVAAGSVILAMVVLSVSLRRFRRRHPVLRDEADLSAFKRLASFQMYVSLASLCLIGVPLVVWGVGKFALGWLTWMDGLLFVVLPFAAQMAFATVEMETAKAVRTSPVADESLAAERDRVAEVWEKKALPEW